MASIDCLIDTNPMAREINSVSGHVDATTAAVVTMRGAVIKAEADAAEHVCQNVNRGFYTLIRSQISQKTAKLQSEVDSLLMQLQQQTRTLLNIKTRMEHDYNMISARYGKLFGTLNQSMKQRIYELDRPTFDFAERDLQQISNRPRQLTSTVPVSQLESIALSQRMIASNVKNHALDVIDTMSEFLTGMADQKKLTNRILLHQTARGESERYMMPAIVSETCIDQSGATNVSVTVCRPALPNAAQERAQNTILNSVNQLKWHDSAQTDHNVENEFNRLLADAAASDRVKRMASELFQAGHPQTL